MPINYSNTEQGGISATQTPTGQAYEHTFVESKETFDISGSGFGSQASGATYFEDTDEFVVSYFNSQTVRIIDASDFSSVKEVDMPSTGGNSPFVVDRRTKKLFAGSNDGPVNVLTEQSGSLDFSSSITTSFDVNLGIGLLPYKNDVVGFGPSGISFIDPAAETEKASVSVSINSSLQILPSSKFSFPRRDRTVFFEGSKDTNNAVFFDAGNQNAVQLAANFPSNFSSSVYVPDIDDHFVLTNESSGSSQSFAAALVDGQTLRTEKTRGSFTKLSSSNDKLITSSALENRFVSVGINGEEFRIFDPLELETLYSDSFALGSFGFDTKRNRIVAIGESGEKARVYNYNPIK